MRLPLTHAIALAAAKDAAARSAHAAGRTAWTVDDWNAAVREYDRLIPPPECAVPSGANR